MPEYTENTTVKDLCDQVSPINGPPGDFFQTIAELQSQLEEEKKKSARALEDLRAKDQALIDLENAAQELVSNLRDHQKSKPKDIDPHEHLMVELEFLIHPPASGGKKIQKRKTT